MQNLKWFQQRNLTRIKGGYFYHVLLNSLHPASPPPNGFGSDPKSERINERTHACTHARTLVGKLPTSEMGHHSNLRYAEIDLKIYGEGAFIGLGANNLLWSVAYRERPTREKRR